MWCLGTWFTGGLGSAQLTVGLDDLKGLFQPKQFYDSICSSAMDLIHMTYTGFIEHALQVALCP